MAETSFDAVAGSLNSNSSPITIITGTLSNNNLTLIDYPTGYTVDNTIILGGQYRTDPQFFTDSWRQLVNGGPDSRVFIGLRSDKISILHNNTANADFKLALTKQEMI